MARLFLSGVGTTGDVALHIALGRALAARGHEIRIGTHALHQGLVEAAGLELVPTAAPVEVQELNSLFERITREPHPTKQFRMVAEELFLKDARGQLERQHAAQEGAALVVAHRFDYLAQEAAIRRGLRFVSLGYTPEAYRTQEAPVYPFLKLGRWWSKLTWDTAERLAAEANAPIARTLAALGCAPRKLGIAGASSPLLDLLAVSPVLVDRRGDWPATVHMTGALTLDDPAPLSAELENFLAAHPRPALISFGSTGGEAAREAGAILSDALDRAGCAALVQRGYGGLEIRPAAGRLLVGHLPYRALLPRVGCVVHHMGIGTTMAAARAGVPQVPVPHMFDQYYWAGRAHQKGIATQPMPRRTLEAKGLAKRIRAALDDQVMQRQATAVREALVGEDGPLRAALAVEALL